MERGTVIWLNFNQTLLWILPVVILTIMGSVSLFIVIKDLFWPDHFVGDMQGTIILFMMMVIIPLCIGLVVGLLLMLLGWNKSGAMFKVGAVLVMAVDVLFLPFALNVIKARDHREKAKLYMNHSDEQLQALVSATNDQAAHNELYTRNMKKKAAFYHKKSCDELFNLWQNEKDQWAYDELNKRLIYYDIQKKQYAPLTETELQRLISENNDQAAWFELKKRQGIDPLR